MVLFSFWVWQIPYSQNKLIIQNYIRWIKSSHANIVLIAILITFKNVIKTTLLSVWGTYTVYLRSISSQINPQLYAWFKIQNKCRLWYCAQCQAKFSECWKTTSKMLLKKMWHALIKQLPLLLWCRNRCSQHGPVVLRRWVPHPQSWALYLPRQLGHIRRDSACWVTTLISNHRIVLNWLACCTLI